MGRSGTCFFALSGCLGCSDNYDAAHFNSNRRNLADARLSDEGTFVLCRGAYSCMASAERCLAVVGIKSLHVSGRCIDMMLLDEYDDNKWRVYQKRMHVRSRTKVWRSMDVGAAHHVTYSKWVHARALNAAARAERC